MVVTLTVYVVDIDMVATGLTQVSQFSVDAGVHKYLYMSVPVAFNCAADPASSRWSVPAFTVGSG